MKLRILTFLGIFFLASSMLRLAYADPFKKEECFSCNIKIDSLDEPIALKGKWLFTRNDSLENRKSNEDNDSKWVLLNTPGSWKKAYNDGKNFRVGWYKGRLQFSENLIGKRVRILLDTYMAETEVFLDGLTIYKRSSQDSVNRYFSIQPIPIEFEVTKEKHVIAIRTNTILMQGIYQLPFHIRSYKKFDPALSFMLFYGGNFRSIAGFILLISGIFFISVYLKTKNDFYLMPGLSGCLIFPFFFFPLDFVTSFIQPEKALISHYIGMAGMMYTQFKVGELFYKKLPKVNLFYVFFASLTALTFFVLLFKFNLKLFQVVRTVSFLIAFLTSALLVVMGRSGVKNNVKGAKTFLMGVSCLILSVFHDLFNALGIIQSTGFIALGMILSTFAIMVVAANNYTDTYVQNQKLLVELKDYAENLEEKVKLATAHIEEEKQKVANLLNNMKQAIFSIDKDLKIIAPASAFSREVFESDIVGTDIFDTLFKDVDKSSEEYSQVFTSMGAVFNNPTELQYDLMCDYFPPRIKYIVEPREDDKRSLEDAEDEEEYKILSINYSPMWNDIEELENLMIVVEDITEKEKLAHELEEQKKTSEKNISIIKEMAKADLDDITHFLKDAPKLIESTMGILRTKSTNPEELTEMFRNLHTLKGNSRVFNFNSISSLTHIAESEVTNIRESKNQGEEISPEIYTHLMGKLYDISAEISEYGALAKKVFRIENEFEKKLIKDINEFTSKIDREIGELISQNELDFAADKPEHLRKEAFDLVKEKDIDPVILSNIKRSTHSLKGSLRSIKKNDATDLVHKFENSFHLFENLDETTIEVFYRDFINNYIEIKDLVKSIYMNSDLNRPINHPNKSWKELFLSFYEFSLAYKTKKEFSKESFENLKELLLSMDLKFLATSLNEWVEPNITEEKKNEIMGNSWSYLASISKLNFTQISDELKEVVCKLLMNLPDDPKKANEVIEAQISSETPPLLDVLNEISLKDQSPNYFFQVAMHFIHLGPEDSKKSFLLDRSETANIKKLEIALKRSHVVTDLPFQLSKMAQEGDSLALSLSQFIKEGGTHNYLKAIDFNQILQSFSKDSASGGKSKVKEMDTIHILSKNYFKLQEMIKEKQDLDSIQRGFDKLIDIPLVNSLSKFEVMVQEISSKLNKKVDFKIKGEDITINKDSYSILQDAFVHILRNSIDHGIEDPEERKKIGKRPSGKIVISCKELNDDRVEISIEDDGGGINVSRVAAKAIENGIITHEKKDSMKQEEIIDLIFLPNFSQKQDVDELSGRGVGMDIVRKNIEDLGGKVIIKSKEGQGTTFVLTNIKTA